MNSKWLLRGLTTAQDNFGFRFAIFQLYTITKFSLVNHPAQSSVQVQTWAWGNVYCCLTFWCIKWETWVEEPLSPCLLCIIRKHPAAWASWHLLTHHLHFMRCRWHLWTSSPRANVEPCPSKAYWVGCGKNHLSTFNSILPASLWLTIPFLVYSQRG